MSSISKKMQVDEPAAGAANDGAVANMTDQEIEWKQTINAKLLEILDLSLIETIGEEKARQEIRETANRLLAEESAPLSLRQRQAVVKCIEDEVMGLGPLEPLLADSTVSDILVNGHDTIFVERRGRLEHTNLRFSDHGHLMNTIDRIVSAVGRRIDESSPMVDARLADGSRVNAVIPPLALDGAMLSIRRFAVERLTMDKLIDFETVTPEVASVLQAVVKGRLNVLVSGGTGAGKTTLLNILSSCIPECERIITIEDSAELQLQQPHVVRLETRPANIEGKGEVGARDLVKNALRMRPERIVVGEVRGGEALDMLQAMNTGHDGSLTTIHANTPRDAIGRVENMVSMTGIAFPIKALRAQIASAIDVVVQVARLEDGRRKIVSVQEINGMEGDIITMSEIFRFERTGINKEGEVQGYFTTTGIIPKFLDKMQKRGFDIGYDVFENSRQAS